MRLMSKRAKKASLSLSINAIVILVLAITMLGLGLGFTKGMFAKFSSKLEVPEPDIPATADDPIVLPADTINVQKNKEAIFSVNVYNDGWSGDVSPADVECSPTMTVTKGMDQSIAVGEDAAFKFIIPKADGNTGTSGNFICKLSFAGSDGADVKSKQIVISIK